MMTLEELGRALDNAFAMMVESITNIAKAIRERGINRHQIVHITACAKRKRQPHVKRSYIGRRA